MKHLKDVNMTYIQHFYYAIKLSARLYYLSYISLVHAIFPCLFTETVSSDICKINEKLNNR